ncbi:MAG: UDP-N-acetylenolpyruvoylglucosamine reductase [Cycloclasticus sp. symbiont of Poecilosclerida sp. M]|nr:MAG: UDP-N-acetylenolpyruvoylglucosamine reductase [Cycloclasticus sp. symbiont of Poecilosclerida sp. M]
MAMNQSSQIQGKLFSNEPLARYTSWRVGGNAERLYKPLSVEDLQSYIQQIPEGESLTWLGLGSNVLIRDGGIKGTVIYTRGCLNQLNYLSEENVYAEAGVPCAHVAKLAAEKGLAGAEFLAGIPGTMGGALAMNAGAFGGETWNLVDKVVLINAVGDLITRSADEFEIAYRSVSLKEGEWFVGCYLHIPVEENGKGREKIKELLAKRAKTQPTNLPSGGSVFKNPESDHAARLIEASGLKGLRLGGAQVSEKHANFIVNIGKASAADIEALIERVKAGVLEQQGVMLETEVRVIGEGLSR